MPDNTSLIALNDSLQNLNCPLKAWQRMNAEMDQFGFSGGTYILYTELRHGSITDDMVFYSTYNPDFLRSYIDEGMADHDYAVLHCSHSDEPVKWHQIKDRYNTPKRDTFNDFSSDYGLRDGFVIPIKDRQDLLISGIGFCVSNENETDATRLLDEEWEYISQACILFDEVIKSPRKLPKIYKLSPREIDCIRQVCLGKFNQEIADKLFLSDKTVEHYLANAARKLHCRNKHHLAAKATMLGLVSF